MSCWFLFQSGVRFRVGGPLPLGVLRVGGMLLRVVGVRTGVLGHLVAVDVMTGDMNHLCDLSHLDSLPGTVIALIKFH